MDAHKNFAVTTVTVAPSPATSGTSLTVQDASVFPATPFNVTLCPSDQIPTPSNAEIARCTNITGSVLTITRAQEGTSARSVQVGDLIAATITAKVITDIEAAIPSTAGLLSAVKVSAGTLSSHVSALTLANGNGVSFGFDGATLTASVATNYQSQGAYLTTARASTDALGLNTAASNVTWTANSGGVSIDARGYAGTATGATNASVTVNSGGVSVSVGNYLTSQSNQAFSAAGGSSAFQTLGFSNANGFTFSNSNGSVVGSYTVPTVTAGSDTLGISNLGNTSGTSGVISGDQVRLLLAGGNNITLSQSINGASATITISGANAGGAQTGISGISAGTTQATSGTVSYADSNGVSWGMNGQTLTATVKTDYLTTARASNDALGLNTAQSNVTWTANSAGLSLDARGYAGTGTTFNGANISGSITQNSNGLALSLSVAPGGGGADGYNIIAAGGSTAATTGTVVFSNSNGISFSLNGATVTASHNGLTSQSNQAFSAAGGSSAFQTLGFSDNGYASWTNTNGSVAIAELRGSFFAASNTTQGSSGTQNLDAVTFAGAGIASVGITNGSIVVSVPSGGGAGDGGVFFGVSTDGNTAGSTGTVSTGNVVLVGGVGISLSQSTGAAGSAATITINGHTHGVQSWWANAVGDLAAVIGTVAGNSLVSVRKVMLAEPLACSDMRIAASASHATAANASSAFYDYSVSAVLYSRTGSTLSSMLSGSQASWASWSSNATASLAGVNAYVVPWATSAVLDPGEYWIALHLSTTNTATGGAGTTALGNSQSMLGVNPIATAVAGMKPVGVGVNASYGVVSGQGLVSTGATLASLAISNVTVTGSRGVVAALWVELRNYSL